MYKMNDKTMTRHNSVVLVVGPLLLQSDAGMTDTPKEYIDDMYWAILESLCCSVGSSLGLTEREIAEKVEVIAARFASGEFKAKRIGWPI